MSNVPSLYKAHEAPKEVDVIEGGKMNVKSCPGGSGTKAAVYHHLKISRDKMRLICKKCENKEWSLITNKGSLSTII